MLWIRINFFQPAGSNGVRNLAWLAIAMLASLPLTGCKSDEAKAKEEPAATMSKEEKIRALYEMEADKKRQAVENAAKERQADQPPPVSDFNDFLARLRAAIASRDAFALAPLMTNDFGYNMNPVMQGPGVFQFWDQNNTWVELEYVLNEDWVPSGNYMVAPPQFADPQAQYRGFRGGARLINGGWRFAYFIDG